MTEPIEYHIEPRDEGRAFLVVKCKTSTMGECRFGLWQRPAGNITWQWDGNASQPTIQPSIACNGGCGRHFSVIAGAVV